MSRLQDCYVRCCKMLDDMNIPYFKDIESVTINPRMYKSLASTSYKSRPVFDKYGVRRDEITWAKIEFNPAMLDDSVPESELEDTMLHELLHTCTGCQSHMGAWKRYAMMVSRRYGYNITRCGDVDAVNQRYEDHKNIKYKIACQKCGYVWDYQRIGNVVKNPEKYRHQGCGGSLERIL